MIHSARPTVLPVANIVFALFCFARFWKVGTDGRTDNMCKNNDPYRPWLWVGRVDQFTRHSRMCGWYFMMVYIFSLYFLFCSHFLEISAGKTFWIYKVQNIWGHFCDINVFFLWYLHSNIVQLFLPSSYLKKSIVLCTYIINFQ